MRVKLFLLEISSATMGLLTLFPGAFAQTNKPYTPQCDLDHIASMVGSVGLSLGVERVASPTMACLLRLWREDKGGTTEYYVSSAFLAIMDENPQVFFASMSTARSVFDEWLNRLEANLFTWPLDPPCPLDTRRTQLIDHLQRIEIKPANLSALKMAVITQLSSIRCRQIK